MIHAPYSHIVFCFRVGFGCEIFYHTRHGTKRGKESEMRNASYEIMYVSHLELQFYIIYELTVSYHVSTKGTKAQQRVEQTFQK